MTNAWAVIWFENGHKLKKTGFDGDSPQASGVIDYAKSIVARGFSAAEVHVISMRRGYPPTAKLKAKQPSGTSWCPYCLKWREFRTFAIKRDGVVGPEDLRCPICTITINDYYVRKYNPVLIARASTTAPRLPKAKVVPARRRNGS